MEDPTVLPRICQEYLVIVSSGMEIAAELRISQEYLVIVVGI